MNHYEQWEQYPSNWEQTPWDTPSNGYSEEPFNNGGLQDTAWQAMSIEDGGEPEHPSSRYEMETSFSQTDSYTFYVQPFFTEADGSTKYPFMGIFGKYSRVVFNILNKKNGKWDGSFANLGIQEIPDLAERTRFAFTRHEEELLQRTEENASPAYTVRLKSGMLKGRTPAEILFENWDNYNVLLQQLEFLMGQTNPRFRKSNEEQIQAIEDALNLANTGMLDPNALRKTVPYSIYEGTFKPLMNRKNEQGQNYVYWLAVTAYLGADIPVEVKISSYYAECCRDEQGRPKYGRKPDNVPLTVHTATLSFKEWNKHVDMLVSLRAAFIKEKAPVMRAREEENRYAR